MRAVLLVLIAVSMMACGGGQHAAIPGGSTGPTDTTTPPPPNPRDPDPTNPGGSSGPNWPNGATVNLIVPEVNSLEQYTGRPMNFPSGTPIVAKLNIDLNDVASGDRETYGGGIRIGYAEPQNGTFVFKEAFFESGLTLQEAQYNEFQNFSGKTVIRIFAEDLYGAVLLVLDQFDDNNNVGGAVYFHNFTPTYAQKPLPPTGRCWFIKIGPYDCRDFLVGSGDDDDKNISMGSSIYPNRVKNGEPFYKKLGTFQGLDGVKAFGL
jgi:hypothetical protein